MIICENLVKNYGSKRVIDQVSFEIKPGEIIVVTGPSGAGKSTLLRIASLIENPNTGSVKIDAIEYQFNNKKHRTIREQFPNVGVVFQNLFLWPHLTNRENIQLPLKGQFSLDKRNELDYLIQLFSLSDFIEKYPNQCSLGQRQRIALIRAFLLNPKYLFLDEITSSLDIEQIGILLNYLRALKEKGTAIFLITHFLKFAQLAADQIIFMEHGHIVENGGREILVSPKTERLKQFLNTLEYIVAR
jgi:ABC-type polar amino acid transport system ATPase subunit